jgi:hypothetical protein
MLFGRLLTPSRTVDLGDKAKEGLGDQSSALDGSARHRCLQVAGRLMGGGRQGVWAKTPTFWLSTGERFGG